jgi:hypothetical protein
VIWRWVLRMVPWRTIVLHAPAIMKAARRYYGETRTAYPDAEPRARRAEGIEPVWHALEKQAALVDDLARQVQEMAAALEVLRARVRLALIGASLALGVALVAVALLLWTT